MIIDSHNHPYYQMMNLEKTLENMKRFNIDRTWLLSLETPEHEAWPVYHPKTFGTKDAAIPFAHCLEYSMKAPDQFVLGYAPDPRQPHVIQKMEAAIELYGVRVCGEIMLRMTYDHPDAISLFRFCGEKGLPVIVEVNYGVEEEGPFAQPGYWYGGGIEAFERLVRACPDTVFLGHGPGFWAHISGDDLYQTMSYPQGEIVSGGKVIEMMHTYDNLYCDLSAYSGYNALIRTPSFGKEFLLEFQDRVLYGRDCWDNNLQLFLNGAGFTEEVLYKIYAGNSLKLVPLK
ncbi:amidohydrolase family protein [Paenibacillus sp. GCM10027626]|uniref:amidohydrolase family protein n=1 Tax=Paenibacillus sp. GCM10027626 TaxID=3273411 RepID=UPI00362CD379